MASTSSLSGRRLLNNKGLGPVCAGGRRAFLIALLFPAALFAAPHSSASLALLDPPGSIYPMLSGSGNGLGQDSAEATFDRTLNFSGKLDLSVKNGAGNIHLTRGTANQLHVHARVHSRFGSNAAEVREIADHPPIEQTGNIIRIGGVTPRSGFNHISIDYEIEAPADAALEVTSGSGNVTDEGVGQDAKLMTGSGNIKATGLQGGFKAGSGSGNISIENAGDGDAKADTGSGNIDVKGVHGALKAGTGSGNIKAWGTPTSAWKLQTGSGNVEFTPPESAPLTLDASAGSGRISTDRPLTAQVSSSRHRLHGDLNGGGPVVRISTGSGNIRIH